MLSKVIEMKIQGRLCVLTLERPHGYSYDAGQYCDIRIGEVSRSFSFLSIPSDGELKFGIEIVKDSLFSQALMSISGGEDILITQAQGRYQIDENYEKLTLLSGGIGVVPHLSFLDDLAIKGKLVMVRVLASYRGQEFFADKLKSFEGKGANVSITNTSTQSRFDFSDLSFAENEGVYICGSSEFVSNTIGDLSDRCTNLHFETFSG